MNLRTEFMCPASDELAAKRVAEIEAEGGFAWARPEYASEMGTPHVYQGHRILYLTLDDMREHIAQFEARS